MVVPFMTFYWECNWRGQQAFICNKYTYSHYTDTATENNPEDTTRKPKIYIVRQDGLVHVRGFITSKSATLC